MATDAGSTGAAAGGTGPTGRDRSMRPPWLPLIAAAVVVPAVLAGLTLLWSAPQIEGALTERAQAALSAAGISGAGVRFDGRDATITGLTGAAAERAAQVVAGATGVRVAVVGGGAGAAPVPPPTGPRSGAGARTGTGTAPAPGLRPLRGRHRRLRPRLLQRRRLHRRRAWVGARTCPYACAAAVAGGRPGRRGEAGAPGEDQRAGGGRADHVRPGQPAAHRAGRGDARAGARGRRAAPGARLEIDGYVATGRGNGLLTAQQLSDQRAATVRDALVAGGVPADHLTARGRGEDTAATDRAFGRRVEITVV